jgi:hypothetical protein
MSSSFITALNAEICDLRLQLESDPRFLKLRQLESVLEMYANTAATPAQAAGPSAAESKPKEPARGLTPERQKALDLVKEYLSKKAGPVKTVVLNAHLEEHGAQLPGVNPQNNLSTFLARMPELKSHGRAGWTLALPDNDVGKVTEAVDDVPAEEASTASMSSPELATGGTKAVEPSQWIREAGPGGGT